MSGSNGNGYVYSTLSSGVALGSSGSYNKFGLSLNSGYDLIGVSGSYDSLNLTAPDSTIAAGFSGSYEQFNFKSDNNGEIGVLSSGSYSNVNSIGGSVMEAYGGSHNIINFTNEMVASVSCIAGNHNIVNSKNTTIKYNSCKP